MTASVVDASSLVVLVFRPFDIACMRRAELERARTTGNSGDEPCEGEAAVQSVRGHATVRWKRTSRREFAAREAAIAGSFLFLPPWGSRSPTSALSFLDASGVRARERPLEGEPRWCGARGPASSTFHPHVRWLSADPRWIERVRSRRPHLL
jgi:hypothetical protein